MERDAALVLRDISFSRSVLRFIRASFSYNVAYAVFSGLTPVLVSLLLPLDAMAPVHYVIALSMLGVAIGLYFHRRSTVIS